VHTTNLLTSGVLCTMPSRPLHQPIVLTPGFFRFIRNLVPLERHTRIEAHFRLLRLPTPRPFRVEGRLSATAGVSFHSMPGTCSEERSGPSATSSLPKASSARVPLAVTIRTAAAKFESRTQFVTLEMNHFAGAWLCGMTPIGRDLPSKRSATNAQGTAKRLGRRSRAADGWWACRLNPQSEDPSYCCNTNRNASEVSLVLQINTVRTTILDGSTSFLHAMLH